MGLFDTITDELFCPFCGAKVKDFQTKDLGQNMMDWTIADIVSIMSPKWSDDINIYSQCPKCKKWVHIVLRGENMSHDELERLMIERRIKKKIKERIKRRMRA